MLAAGGPVAQTASFFASSLVTEPNVVFRPLTLGVDPGLETHVKRSILDGQLVAAVPLAASWSTGPLVPWLLLHALATASVRLGVLYTFAL
ncbi:MAG: hypothetical protein ACOC2D_19015 [Spirochaetota bacterium]